jgi:glutamate-1-semialdehyde 2,1-aminomutase
MPGLTERERGRLNELIEEQERIFIERQPGSTELIGRARASLAGGATSSWQIARPQMVWISRGEGSRIFDVDGTEYVDLHGGYGVSAIGHGHPRLVEVLREQIARGTHFAQPVEDAIAVAEELSRRWGLPLWRFSNSGTEATMDAVHLMRAATGRDLIVKVEGCYHGHHDSVMVSVQNEADELGPRERPHSPPAGTGIPEAITELTLIVPYNDLEVLERLLIERTGEIAGMIMEPIMMNAGIIEPIDGYIEGVRELTREHDVLLAFDEVKTGFTAAYGGATEVLGVTPDIVCLAKSLGGGVPCGAIGGTEDVMSTIVRGDYDQVGTFNGNPLTMAATKVAITEILDDAAYEHFARLRDVAETEMTKIIEAYELGAHIVAVGAKGCVTFQREPVRDYRGFIALPDGPSHAHWLFQHNGGVFLPPWGKSEQWLFSVLHSVDDVQRFVDNFERFASAWRA